MIDESEIQKPTPSDYEGYERVLRYNKMIARNSVGLKCDELCAKSKRAIETLFGVNLETAWQSRKREYVELRYMLFLLMSSHTEASDSTIARICHATRCAVNHGRKAIVSWMKYDEGLKEKYKMLEEMTTIQDS